MEKHPFSKILVCPFCKLGIKNQGNDWLCPSCNRSFTLNREIISFLSPEERFNETPFEERQLEAWTFSANRRKKIRSNRFLSMANEIRIKFSMSGRRDRFFIQELKKSNEPKPLILDLGCGGGRYYFAEFGSVIGIDPVIDLLEIARTLYDDVFQCSGFNLPFCDNTFDFVVSSDVIGHIANENKEKLFSEIHRVLKPGGRTIHCSEALGQSPWWKFAQKYPELFKKHFIDKPGHIGMELPTTIRQRFLDQGFKEIRLLKLSSILQEPGTLVAFFDNEYRSQSRVISFFVGIDRLLSRSFLIKEMLNFIIEPLALIDDFITPLNYGGGVLICYEK